MKIIIKIFFLFLLLSTGDVIKAQAQKSAQQQLQELIRKKIAEAGGDPKSDSIIRQAMEYNNYVWDSMSKIHPELKVFNPEVDVHEDDNKDLVSQNSTGLWPSEDQIKQTLPKVNAFSNVEKLQKLKVNDIQSLATTIIKESNSRINSTIQDVLDKMVKNNSINSAGTGAFVLASGGSATAAVVLICRGILKNPKDPWAVNDLGVYFRQKNQLEKALQCYLYAEELTFGKSKEICTNIGWAAAYYGDFNTAIRYFDKALSLDADYSQALEGEALLAYQKGDIKKLFECLVKEIKFIGGSGGSNNDGPSDAFASICGGVYTDNIMEAEEQSEEPDDGIFSNSIPDEGTSQDPPPGADVAPLTFPNFKKVFINDAKELMNVHLEYLAQSNEAQKTTSYLINKEKQMFRTKRSVFATPYMEGDKIVYPKSFSKYLTLFNMVLMQFESKVNWYGTELHKKINKYGEQVKTIDGDMMTQCTKELGQCKGNAECEDKVLCTWIPKMNHSKQNDLDVVARIWDDYYSQVASAIQGFINKSAPFISRVHDEEWNNYLNTERELEVRTAILTSYNEWDNSLTAINGPIIWYMQAYKTNCTRIEVAGNPPDPFSKKPKHIKEFEGPCFDIKDDATVPFVGGIGSEITCHATTISLGVGPFKVFYTHVDDPIYAQNNEYTHEGGFSASISKSIEIVKDEDLDKSLNLVEGSAEGSASFKFDNEFNFKSADTKVSASASAFNQEVAGISASRTVKMVAGQLSFSPVVVNSSSIAQ